MLKKGVYIAIIGLLLLSGCSEFQRLQKKGTYIEKYEAALTYFEKNDFYRASVLLESIIPLTKGKKEAEDVQYKYATCQLKQKEFYLASYYFKKFYETFPRSELAEDAMYMSAVSLFRISPKHELDQDNTYKAIEAFQGFINKYPKTKYKEECNTKIDVLQEKLELKNYENAKLQFKIGHYRAAVICFDNFAKDFPDSDYNEELQYLKVESQFLFAKNSLTKVKKDGKTHYLKRDRLLKTKDFYYTFIDQYKTSGFLVDAESIFKKTNNEIQELEK